MTLPRPRLPPVIRPDAREQLDVAQPERPGPNGIDGR